LDVFANLAEAVLISMTGRVRYMLELPLTCDAMRFTSHDVTGLSVAKGFFFLPWTAIPFLYEVLRIPWRNANNEYAEAAIVRGAATNRDIARRMRAGGWVYPLREVVDMIKYGAPTRDEDIQDPVMSGHELLDLHVQHRKIRRGNGGEIEQIGDSSFDPDGVLTPTFDPATNPDAMDVSEPARIDTT
jgi:hypothetical protein